MTTHTVGTREEWHRARVELLVAEKALTRQGDELTQQRLALPWVPIDDYTFEGEDGPVNLTDLFDGRSQLIVVHFMFAPSWEAGCPSCSGVADSWVDTRVHLVNHDVAMVAVSRAPIDKLMAYRERMGWDFPWLSSGASPFNFDFGVSYTERQLADRAEHNFRPLDIDVSGLAHQGQSDDPADDWECPGMSAFALEDGQLFHTYSTYDRGMDVLWGMFQWLDRAPFGRSESTLDFRRHDEYEG